MFKKLVQGCSENEEILALANARAEAEYAYGSRLNEIPVSLAPRKDGFGADEGASLRRSYEGIIKEMGEEGQHHVQVAENIRKMVIQPFGKWAAEHKERVDFSYDFLKGKVKSYEKEGQEVQKIQNRYFNKCRLYDDAKQEEETKLLEEQAKKEHLDSQGALSTSEADPPIPPESAPLASSSSSATISATTPVETPASSAEEDDEEEIELADVPYTRVMIRKLLSNMLAEIPQKNIKISILGTYDHISTGSEIVTWLTANVTSGSIPVAEKLGQDLIQNGFLRLVGQVGNKFANSSVFNYQWKRLAFTRAGLEQEQKSGNDLISSMAGEYLPGAISNYLSNPNPNETPIEKLAREVKELDQKTYEAITKYDTTRTTLEETIIRHLSYMERCENDRLKAIKVVLLDFTAAISNKVAGLKATLEKCLLYQESIVPERDIRYLIEENKTGFFVPKVTVYDNYYNPDEGWTFGGDIEMRARGDGKRVPLIVSAILRHLDDQYPLLQNDEVRLGVWTVEVPLEETHKLRKALNNGLSIDSETLSKFKAPIVASALKLYLLELPDSLVPSKSYELIKAIYNEQGGVEHQAARFKEIQALLQPLKLSSIATIDAISKHLERLMKIAKPSEEYRVSLGQELSFLFLRPKTQNLVTMSDRHGYFLARDFLENRNAIFDELKRKNSAASRRTSTFSSSTSSSAGSSKSLQRSVPVSGRHQQQMSSSLSPHADSHAATNSLNSSYRFDENTSFHVRPLNNAGSEETTGTSRFQFQTTAATSGSGNSAVPNGVEVIEVDDDDEVQVVNPPS